MTALTYQVIVVIAYRDTEGASLNKHESRGRQWSAVCGGACHGGCTCGTVRV